MGVRRTLVVLAIGILLVSGCSAESSNSSERVSAESSTAAAATPSVASENQVASIVARYEPQMREVVEAAGSCRSVWVLGDRSDPLVGADAYICYTSEQTAAINASLLSAELAEILPPESMTNLVERTSVVLDAIAAIDLPDVCGTESFPNDTEECTAAVGSLYGLYRQLDAQLNAWGPYL